MTNVEVVATTTVATTAMSDSSSLENVALGSSYATAFPGAPAGSDENCLFVFHIPRDWNDEDLARQFVQYGKVTLAKVTRWPDTTSRGFGFVAFEDQACAGVALREVDGKLVDDGKRLRVSVKKSKDEASAEVMYGKQSVPGIGPVGPYAGPSGSLPPATSTCFVFYVPSNWDDEEMKSNFSKVGTVVSSCVARKPDGASRGFGFVSFASAEMAQAAVTQMNGFILSNGKRLKVSLKTDSSQGASFNSQYSGASAGPYSPTYFGCNIFVASFPANWTEEELRSHFLACGKIVSASIRRSQDTQESAGYGFVTFDSQEGAQTAVSKMNGVMIGGRKLRVSIKRGEEGNNAYGVSSPYGFPAAQGVYNPATAGNYMSQQSAMSPYANPAATGYGFMSNPYGVSANDQYRQMGFDPYQFYSSFAGSEALSGMAGMNGMFGTPYTHTDSSASQLTGSKAISPFTQVSTAGGLASQRPSGGIEAQTANNTADSSGWGGYAAAAAALGAMQQDGGAGRTGIGASAVDSQSQNVASGGVKNQNPQQASAVRGSWDMSANIAAMQQLALMQQWQLQQQAQGGAAYGAAAAAKTGTHPMMTQYNIPGNLYGYGAQNVATAAAVPTGSNPLYGANPSVSVQRK